MNPVHKKIFVIDDEPTLREVMRLILARAGYSVTTSEDGSEIIELKDNPPDLFLIDILLAGKDGRDIARTIKENSLTKDIPVILISAHASAASSVADCMADDFIAKPFEMKELLSKVATYVH